MICKIQSIKTADLADARNRRDSPAYSTLDTPTSLVTRMLLNVDHEVHGVFQHMQAAQELIKNINYQRYKCVVNVTIR